MIRIARWENFMKLDGIADVTTGRGDRCLGIMAAYAFDPIAGWVKLSQRQWNATAFSSCYAYP
jgi:hypothetical protein